jgi:hypothetical protein
MEDRLMQMKKLARFRNVVIAIAATATVAAVGCTTSSGSLPPPEQLMTSSTTGVDADIAALKRGRALVITECATCHRLYWPHEYSPEEWEGILRKMGRLASLSEGQIRDIQIYMRAASGAQHEKARTME